MCLGGMGNIEFEMDIRKWGLQSMGSKELRAPANSHKVSLEADPPVSVKPPYEWSPSWYFDCKLMSKLASW